jgi:peptidyl-prolyl cis-trans isomerase B (cyclophilin B)
MLPGVSSPSPVAGRRLFPAGVRGRLAAVGAVGLAAVGAVGLAACGSSAGGGSVGSTGAQATRIAAAAGGAQESCRRVATPTPRGPEDVPRPNLRLAAVRRYVVTLTTNCGTIEILLDVRRAPRTASSFAYLVKRGFYDGLTFHRVVAGFVIQGGDPEGDGSGGPGYTIVERPPANLRYTRGTVAMAKTGTDPAGASGSQFFIVTAPDAELPAQYALVGRVVGSLAGVEAISKLATEDGEPTRSVVIGRATLSES